jgi:hypothetical protein
MIIFCVLLPLRPLDVDRLLDSSTLHALRINHVLEETQTCLSDS